MGNNLWKSRTHGSVASDNHYVTFRAKVKENEAKQNTGSKGSSLALTVGISAETLIWGAGSQTMIKINKTL